MKDSGIDWIGQIPEHWSVRRFKFVFRILKRISGELGYDVLSITQKGIKIKDIESGEGQLAMDYSKYQFLNKGEFAMNHMDLLTGYVDISNYDGVTSPDYRVFKIIDDQNSSRFFLYYLQLGYNQKWFFPFGQGAAQMGRWRLPRESFDNFLVPFPPVDEQKRISNFLDKETTRIDTLISKKQKQIELLQEKRQAIITQSVTKGLNSDEKMKDSGVEWIGEIPEHWKVLPLRRVLLKSIDYRGRTPNKVESGVQLITARNIKNGKIDYEISKEYVTEEDYELLKQRGEPQIGDVLITSEAPLGQVAQVDDLKISLAQRIILFRGNHRMVNDFLLLYLRSDLSQSILSSRSSGSTASGIRSDKLYEIPVIVPSIEDQRNIVEHCKKQDIEIDLLSQKILESIELLKEYRSSLITHAVSGQIDITQYEVSK